VPYRVYRFPPDGLMTPRDTYRACAGWNLHRPVLRGPRHRRRVAARC
jgi:hypothetical protein